MAEKGFGVKEINLIGASGTPTIESPNNLNLNAVNVAISTNVSIGGTLTVTGNVSVGGTLTYEDVTNIDSVGIVTARDGVVVVGRGVSITAGGLNVTAGVTTFSDDVEFKTGGTTIALLDHSQSRLEFQDNMAISFGNHPDVEIAYSNGNDFSIVGQYNGSGDLVTGFRNSSGNILKSFNAVRSDGSAELYFSNSKKLETTNTGVTVTGTLTATSFSGDGSALTGIAVTEAPAADYTITSPTGSYYIFHGGGVDETLQNPTLYLKRGQKYRFNNTTGSSHPFEFRNEANNADYTEGITGSQNGVQFFTVSQGAPAVLRYRCTIHTGSMQGLIYIIDRGRFPQLSKSSNYVIVADDAGKHIKNTSGGWTVNTSTSFSVGDVARVVNASGSSQTVFQASGVTIYSRRDGGVSGDHSIVARGMATLLCTGTNEYYLSGDI